ncbi:hypothetical protein WMY93_008347 [Mugilogobius chulae]|uniref:GP-PDE domain-containing protein n=1 Tax=Mugilogobius chulae TaxID=88201 RepID=A0AAW0PKN2_9GOBI
MAPTHVRATSPFAFLDDSHRLNWDRTEAGEPGHNALNMENQLQLGRLCGLRSKLLRRYQHGPLVWCLSGLYGCHWGAQQRSGPKAGECGCNKVEALALALLAVAFCITLVFLYFWGQAKNDYNDFDWHNFSSLGFWFPWSVVLLVITATFFTYLTALMLLLLCLLSERQRIYLHWAHKACVALVLLFSVVAIALLSHMWSEEWTTLLLSFQVTAPYLHLGGVLLMTVLSWPVAVLSFQTSGVRRVLVLGLFLLLLCSLYLVPLGLYSPCIKDKGSLGPRPALIGHRGAPMLAPENTLMSFEKALQSGCVGLETDVTISLDGVPFLMHDRSLLRTTDVQQVYPDSNTSHPAMFTWSQLQRLNAGAWFLSTDPFSTAGSLQQDDQLQAQNQSVCSLLDYLQLAARSHSLVIFDLYQPPEGHPYRDTWIWHTLDVLNQSSILSSQVLWLPSKLRPLVKEFYPDLLQTSGSLLPLEELQSNNVVKLNLEYSLVSPQLVRQYNAVNISVNLYVVSEPWLYTVAWCCGVQSSPEEYRLMWTLTDLLSLTLVLLIFCFHWSDYTSHTSTTCTLSPLFSLFLLFPHCVSSLCLFLLSPLFVSSMSPFCVSSLLIFPLFCVFSLLSSLHLLSPGLLCPHHVSSLLSSPHYVSSLLVSSFHTMSSLFSPHYISSLLVSSVLTTSPLFAPHYVSSLLVSFLLTISTLSLSPLSSPCLISSLLSSPCLLPSLYISFLLVSSVLTMSHLSLSPLFTPCLLSSLTIAPLSLSPLSSLCLLTSLLSPCVLSPHHVSSFLVSSLLTMSPLFSPHYFSSLSFSSVLTMSPLFSPCLSLSPLFSLYLLSPCLLCPHHVSSPLFSPHHFSSLLSIFPFSLSPLSSPCLLSPCLLCPHYVSSPLFSPHHFSSLLSIFPFSLSPLSSPCLLSPCLLCPHYVSSLLSLSFLVSSLLTMSPLSSLCLLSPCLLCPHYVSSLLSLSFLVSSLLTISTLSLFLLSSLYLLSPCLLCPHHVSSLLSLSFLVSSLLTMSPLSSLCLLSPCLLCPHYVSSLLVSSVLTMSPLFSSLLFSSLLFSSLLFSSLLTISPLSLSPLSSPCLLSCVQVEGAGSDPQLWRTDRDGHRHLQQVRNSERCVAELSEVWSVSSVGSAPSPLEPLPPSCPLSHTRPNCVEPPAV